jgi:hypothetical protein
MARASWFDENANQLLIQEQVDKLQSFTDALADGVVERRELDAQEQRLVAALRRLEPELSDDLHAKVTAVLVEISAYNIMRLLHELRGEHARLAFGQA